MQSNDRLGTPTPDWTLFERIRAAFLSLPQDLELTDVHGARIEVTPSIMAGAIEKAFGLSHVVGFYVGRYGHSWNVTPLGSVIDVLPPWIASGPCLGDAPTMAKHGMYVRLEECEEDYAYTVDVARFTHCQAMDVAAEALRKIDEDRHALMM